MLYLSLRAEPLPKGYLKTELISWGHIMKGLRNDSKEDFFVWKWQKPISNWLIKGGLIIGCTGVSRDAWEQSTSGSMGYSQGLGTTWTRASDTVRRLLPVSSLLLPLAGFILSHWWLGSHTCSWEKHGHWTASDSMTRTTDDHCKGNQQKMLSKREK